MNEKDVIEAQAKASLFGLIAEHRKKCNGSNCSISFLILFLWLKEKGVVFNEEEKMVTMIMGNKNAVKVNPLDMGLSFDPNQAWRYPGWLLLGDPELLKGMLSLQWQ